MYILSIEPTSPDEGEEEGKEIVELESRRELTFRSLFVDRPLQRKRTKYTLAHLKSIIQSSDAELVEALHEQNVLTLDGELAFLPRRSPSFVR